MNNEFDKELNPSQSIFAILGNLCSNPQLYIDGDIHLTEDDFVLNFHKVVFLAINNLISSNGTVKSISEFDIDTYLKTSDKYYLIWKNNNGIEYINNAIEISNNDLFLENYHTIKKMTILRTYKNKGFDISEILDIDAVEPNVLSQQQRKLLNLTETDLITFFTKKALDTRELLKSTVENNTKYFKSGDDIQGLVDRFKLQAEYGYPFRNGYFNTLFNGMRKGKFLLRSATSGGGKTRQALMDLLSIACDEIYNPDKNCWESLGTSKPCLFISTELEKEELQQQMLSFITKLPSNILLAGTYNKGITEIIDKAIKIIDKAPLYFIEMEDFDINDVKHEIERYILNYNVEYIDFDYIQMSPKLSSQIQKSFGHQLKDDQILIELSRTLKNIAKEHNVFIMSSTQLSAIANEGRTNEESRTQNALRGAKGIADKIDFGIIAAPPRSRDIKNLKKIKNLDSEEYPNMSYWIYKNRNHKKNIVVWSSLDLGTMKEKILFITDYNYRPVNDISETEIIVKDDSFTMDEKIEV